MEPHEMTCHRPSLCRVSDVLRQPYPSKAEQRDKDDCLISSLSDLIPHPSFHPLICGLLCLHHKSRRPWNVYNIPAKEVALPNQNAPRIPSSRLSFWIDTWLVTRAERQIPRAEPTWPDVWNRAPPTDCSSLFSSVIQDH
jgi:hypothetical protein